MFKSIQIGELHQSIPPTWLVLTPPDTLSSEIAVGFILFPCARITKYSKGVGMLVCLKLSDVARSLHLDAYTSSYLERIRKQGCYRTVDETLVWQCVGKTVKRKRKEREKKKSMHNGMEATPAPVVARIK